MWIRSLLHLGLDLVRGQGGQRLLLLWMEVIQMEVEVEKEGGRKE
jgi:hypothetical protein